jgi:uncharacterized protein YyaL (SSP411 family)
MMLPVIALAAANEPKIGPPAGGSPYPAAVETRLRSALRAKGTDYEPRTRHLNDDETPKYTNRLILENSPYLLQHAHNPVDWYPWGDEAFERARREKKPVFLSVGYSTCHWCHVMEEESFEDEEIAAYLNQNYIAIKVDRERRPDVDGVYMTAVRLMTNRGGWPMSVWLTADREPFYGGTYFPPRDGDRGSRTGFLTLLKRLRQAYEEDPDRVAATTAELRDKIGESMAVTPGNALPDDSVPRRAFASEKRAFDEKLGGFGQAPKFPRSVRLEALLRYYRRTKDAEALRMVRRTLDAMAAGGMYDQVGGGFHRYSTDARWLVPHFEKMLYDNALLAVAYLEAYQVTGEPDYARVVREILLYVEREMTAPGGGFYSASDADSEGEEGTFFVWTPAQIEAVLPAAEARLVEKYYGISATGNFEGKNILHTQGSLDSTAAALKMDPGEAEKLLTSARARLYEARSKRIPPLTDHKILPSWNGLMISAFARAAQVFGDDTYAAYARAAALFITTKMKKGDRLHRSSLDGQIGGNGYLDDYAFLTAGLLDLYEATFEARWLREAMALQKVTDTHFIDAKDGGYFLTADDAEELLAREKPSYDGAEPSGNSVALLNLLRLYELTTDAAYLQRAEQLLRAFEPSWQQYPTSVPRLLSGIDFWSDRAKEIIIVVPESHAQAEPFLAQLRATYLPNRVVVVVSEGEEQEKLASLVPLVKNKSARGGKPTAYVCERQVCELPTSDPQVFAKQIARLEPLTVTGR